MNDAVLDRPLGWQPIATAPKDGTPILVKFDHEADPYHLEPPQGRTVLTRYGAWCEGGSHLPGKGLAIVVWGGGFWEDEGWSTPTHMPDWWFEVNSEHEVVVNPVEWHPIP